jgi:hypothetical protein
MRSFKAGGVLYEAGSLIASIEQIKLGKIRLNEGKIVPLPAEDDPKFHQLQDYFQQRYNHDLTEELAKHTKKAPVAAEPHKTVVSHPTPGTPKVVTSKPAVKATVTKAVTTKK